MALASPDGVGDRVGRAGAVVEGGGTTTETEVVAPEGSAWTTGAAGELGRSSTNAAYPHPVNASPARVPTKNTLVTIPRPPVDEVAVAPPLDPVSPALGGGWSSTSMRCHTRSWLAAGLFTGLASSSTSRSKARASLSDSSHRRGSVIGSLLVLRV